MDFSPFVIAVFFIVQLLHLFLLQMWEDPTHPTLLKSIWYKPVVFFFWIPVNISNYITLASLQLEPVFDAQIASILLVLSLILQIITCFFVFHKQNLQIGQVFGIILGIVQSSVVAVVIKQFNSLVATSIFSMALTGFFCYSIFKELNEPEPEDEDQLNLANFDLLEKHLTASVRSHITSSVFKGPDSPLFQCRSSNLVTDIFITISSFIIFAVVFAYFLDSVPYPLNWQRTKFFVSIFYFGYLLLNIGWWVYGYNTIGIFTIQKPKSKIHKKINQGNKETFSNSLCAGITHIKISFYATEAKNVNNNSKSSVFKLEMHAYQTKLFKKTTQNFILNSFPGITFPEVASCSISKDFSFFFNSKGEMEKESIQSILQSAFNQCQFALLNPK